MNEVSLTNGKMDEREFNAMVENDRSTDGTVSFSRAHSAEQEIVRGEVFKTDAEAVRHIMKVEGRIGWPRTALLALSKDSQPLLRGWSITPLDDRLLVKYASFKEGYVCETCDGRGHEPAACLSCLGIGSIIRKEGWKPEPCPDCVIVGSENKIPASCGHIPCNGCKGSGLAPGVLAIPDASKQDHSYGDVMAVGADIEDLRPGDRVLFSRMAGIHIHGDQVCCLMRRGEVMGFMRKA
jgi:co-chaperonin GroES (HSP10)